MDEQTREKERNVAANPGDVDAAEALAAAKERDGSGPPPPPGGLALDAPFCSRCGKGPVAIIARVVARIPIEFENRPYGAPERVRFGTEDVVQVVEHRTWPGVEVSDDTPLTALQGEYESGGAECETSVRVQCEGGHEWSTALRMLPLNALKECADEDCRTEPGNNDELCWSHLAPEREAAAAKRAEAAAAKLAEEAAQKEAV